MKGRALKSTDLAIRSVTMMHPATFSTNEFHSTIDRMVADGDLNEIEYTLPDRPHQIKSIYFPKGTVIESIKVNGCEVLE